MAVNINIPSQVTQNITEGVTSTAPSEDAVAHALTFKANTADLAEVATSGDYNDLINQPTIPAAQVNSDWNATSGVAEILNKPTIPSTSGFVPYTGASADLDMGSNNVTADHITLNVSPSGPGYGVGSTQWNNTLGSSETLLKGGSVSLKNGVDLVARIVNKVVPNTTLTKAAYQAVKVSGATGGRLSVGLAQADVDLNSADTIGLVTETIATNQEGFILTVGQIENINTTGSLQGETWADGDVLYLSPSTAGKLTNIKPTGATGHIVVIGYVEYAHANNGKIYVKIMNGWELDELHNVYINPATLADNNLLQYDSATSLWKNESLSTAGVQPTLVSGTSIKTINGTSVLGSGDITVGGGITIGTTAVTSGTDTRVFFQQGGVVQQDANFIFNNTQKRLTLRASGTASTDVPFVVRNSADSANLATIQGDGAVILGTYTSPNTRLSVTGTTTGIYGAGATAFFADSGGAGARIGYDSSARSSTLGALSIGVRGIADGGGASGLNRGVMGQASGSGTNYAGYFDAVNGTSNYALYIQRGWVQGTTGINILSQGALSTDIAFRVRNSVDNTNILTAVGSGEVFIGNSITPSGLSHLFHIRNGLATSTAFAYFDNASYNFDVDRFCNVKLGFNLLAVSGGTHSLALGLGTPPSSRNYQQTIAAWTAISQGTNDSGFAQTGADTAGNNSVYTNYYGRNIVLGGTTQGTGTQKIVLYNGTAPTTTIATAGQLYVEGGALKFRGSSGTITVVAPA